VFSSVWPMPCLPAANNGKHGTDGLNGTVPFIV